ncbi:MAG: hypothetical protein PSV35_03880 [bacterium]|nr:hypothetical protein [bacterium]
MKKLLKKICLSITTILLLLIALFFFIVSTTPGLSVLAALSTLCLPGSVSIHGVEGHLWNKFRISELNYQKDNLKITAKNLSIDWQLKSLMHLQLPINTLNADTLELKQDKTKYILSKIHLAGLLTQQSFNVTS